MRITQAVFRTRYSIFSSGVADEEIYKTLSRRIVLVMAIQHKYLQVWVREICIKSDGIDFEVEERHDTDSDANK